MTALITRRQPGAEAGAGYRWVVQTLQLEPADGNLARSDGAPSGLVSSGGPPLAWQGPGIRI